MSELERALRAFDAAEFAHRHGGWKESRSARSHEYLLTCRCGSQRLRWRHEPGGRMAWICWGCRRSGNTIDLVQWLEGVSQLDAHRYIVEGYDGGDAPTSLAPGLRMAPPLRPALTRLPPVRLPRGVEPLSAHAPAHAGAWAYLRGRGVEPADVARRRLAVGVRGFLLHYVVFPVYMDGGLVYWQGRACWDPPRHLTAPQRKAWAKATAYRKTLNPRAGGDVAGASDVLFGHDLAAVQPHVVVVEGPIDAVKVGDHAVALLGKVPTPAKVERLLRMRAQRYTIYFDRGEEEHAQACALARQLAVYAPTHIATPPVGEDPGSLTRAQNAAQIAAAPAFRARGLRGGLRVC